MKGIVVFFRKRRCLFS